MLTLLQTLILLLRLLQPELLPAELVVTLRDEAGIGVADAAIVVREVEGSAILATARTDDDGQAQVNGIVAPVVRVLVRGPVPTGRPLSLTGQDADGIRVFLGSGPVRLDLRVGDDGRVVIDPTMFVQERAGALASAVPIAPLDPLRPVPPAPTIAGWSPRDAPTILEPAPTNEMTGTVVGLAEVELPPAAERRLEPLLLVLILLCLAALVLVLLASRRRAP
jgi:hypothetical protein